VKENNNDSNRDENLDSTIMHKNVTSYKYPLHHHNNSCNHHHQQQQHQDFTQKKKSIQGYKIISSPSFTFKLNSNFFFLFFFLFFFFFFFNSFFFNF
jgi:ATP-dependent Zn protease